MQTRPDLQLGLQIVVPLLQQLLLVLHSCLSSSHVSLPPGQLLAFCLQVPLAQGQLVRCLAVGLVNLPSLLHALPGFLLQGRPSVDALDLLGATDQ